jgi:large subunit ribosomal protein L6
VSVKGPQGEVQKTFSKKASITVEGSEAKVVSKNAALSGTIESIIGSMIHGVSAGYTRKLKLLYAHFPISVEVRGSELIIKNFIGEKQPRVTAVVRNTKVEVKGQNVTVSGPDKEAVGQTIANMKSAMRIRDRDARVFQDGIYDVEEGE